MTLEAIKYANGKLEILDQLKLPFETVYLRIETIQDGWNAINKMNVRGAPAIAITGALTVAVELTKRTFNSIDELKKFTFESLDYLVTSRPTAVNMADAAAKIKNHFLDKEKEASENANYLKEMIIEKITSMQKEDIDTNKTMGRYGAEHILRTLVADKETTRDKKVNILTHCNTGSLATGGYGTALGVVRRLHELGRLEHCYCTETRPYNQGSRLTAYELVYEHMPATLICDDMVGLLLRTRPVDAIVVGADRVVANGDTANKIGTYQLAVLARHHRVPFYVALPSTTVDLGKRTGSEICIEMRPPHEVTHINNVRVAAEGINCWNPSFDVTPGELVTGGFITEFGVFKPEELENQISSKLKKQ